MVQIMVEQFLSLCTEDQILVGVLTPLVVWLIGQSIHYGVKGAGAGFIKYIGTPLLAKYIVAPLLTWWRSPSRSELRLRRMETMIEGLDRSWHGSPTA